MSYSCHRSSRFPIKIVILQNIVGFVNDTMRYAANHQIVQSKITHYNNIGQDKLRKVHALSGLKRKPKELLQEEKLTCDIN